jgi:uncharacterized phage-associated protein
MAKYSVEEIANYFLTNVKAEKMRINPLKLMKLIYFSYAWYLSFTDEDLFEDEIQAWKHGPVVEKVYQEFKKFGLYGDISDEYFYKAELEENDLKLSIPYIDRELIYKDLPLNNALVGTWEYYKYKSGDELEAISHTAGSPWSECYQKGQNKIINKEPYIRDLIKSRAKEAHTNAIKYLTDKGVIKNK